MKKLGYLLLSLLLVASFIMGCAKKEESYEIFISKVISPQTHEEINKIIEKTAPQEISKNDSGEIFGIFIEEDLKRIFGDCLNEEAIPKINLFIFDGVIKNKKITSVKDLKISDVKKEEKSDFIYLTCKANYVYVTSDNKDIEMEDIFSFHINKENKLIDDIKINPSSSIIKFDKGLKK